MKRLLLSFVLLLSLNKVIYYNKPEYRNDISKIAVTEAVAKEAPKPEVDWVKRFTERIGELESNNNPDTVSASGRYIGKYQLGDLAFKDIGYSINLREFKKNPSILPEERQTELFLEFCLKNKEYLKDEINSHSGKRVKGIRITKAGILGAAHLVGHRHVKTFLKTKGRVDKADGNDMRCSDYMREFENIPDSEFSIKDHLAQGYNKKSR